MAGAAACCWAKLRPNRSAFQTQEKKQEQSKKLLFGNLRKIWGTLGIFFMTRVKQKGGREEGEGGWHHFQLCNVFASSLSPQSSHTDKHTQRLTKSYICIQNVIKSGGLYTLRMYSPCAVLSGVILLTFAPLSLSAFISLGNNINLWNPVTILAFCPTEFFIRY